MMLEKKINIRKLSDLIKYFSELKKKLKNVSIIKVCCLVNNSPDDEGKYFLDEEVYIIFKNQTMLIIDYRNIDGLFVQYKKMSKNEIERFSKIDCLDLFNRTDEVYDYKTLMLSRRINYIFDYGSIKDIKIKKYLKEYKVWENNELCQKNSNSETFCEFSIILDNGNEFCFEPEDPIHDGYMTVKPKNIETHLQKF